MRTTMAATDLAPPATIVAVLLLYVHAVVHRTKGQSRRDARMAQITRGEVSGFEKPRDESRLL
jgi:hypothetical protein